MLPMYSTVKSTHLYSLAGNFSKFGKCLPLLASGKPLGSSVNEHLSEACY